MPPRAGRRAGDPAQHCKRPAVLVAVERDEACLALHHPSDARIAQVSFKDHQVSFPVSALGTIFHGIRALVNRARVEELGRLTLAIVPATSVVTAAWEDRPSQCSRPQSE